VCVCVCVCFIYVYIAFARDASAVATRFGHVSPESAGDEWLTYMYIVDIYIDR